MPALQELCDEYRMLVDTGKITRDFPQCLKKSRVLFVDIKGQALHHYHANCRVKSYRVSTARRGAGCREGSGCTPLGWHSVAEKIGAGVPSGTIFKGRIAGDIATNLSSVHDDDLITSRILWLRGLQAGFNACGSVDSYGRYIYIHGTAQEQMIGRAVSHGCVRMCNADVIELFDLVDDWTIVRICHCFVDDGALS